MPGPMKARILDHQLPPSGTGTERYISLRLALLMLSGSLSSEGGLVSRLESELTARFLETGDARELGVRHSRGGGEMVGVVY